jgi:SAM-dependent methyltransferase
MSRENGQSLPQRQSDACLACGCGSLDLVEAVPVTRIAELYALERTDGVGAPADAAGWLAAVRRALGVDVVRFDRCKSCGLEMASPRLAWPENSYPANEDYPIRWEFEQCLKDLGNRPLRILELGCGDGQFLARAKERGHSATGIDFNPTAVSRAAANGLNAVCGGFDQLQQHLERAGSTLTFDAVVCFHVIEHLADPDRLFDGLEPFVRAGTVIALSCPGPDRFTRLVREQQVGNRDFWDYPPHHVLRWTVTALGTYLRGRGWSVRTARNEPLPVVGAAAHIGCTRARRAGYVRAPFRRRCAILWAYARLAAAALTARVSGLSIYVTAVRSP